MPRPPRVSIVIPVRNRPGLVRRAIASVLAQTVQDFELFVVDDGSTDDTVAAVAAVNDPRLSLIEHGRPRGASAARNTGIRAGSAPYVAFLDSDDQWLPAKLERQLEVFDTSPAAPGLVYTGAEYILHDGRIGRHTNPRHHADLKRALLARNVIGGTSVGMVRRDALEAIGGFDERLPARQDVDLWLRLSQRYPVDFVPEVLVQISKGNGQGRISASVMAKVAARDLFCEKHRELLSREHLLHVYLRHSGWVHYREASNARMARRFYLESIVAGPFALFSYLLLLVGFMPPSWIDDVSRWKRQLLGSRRVSCEAWRARAAYRTASTRHAQK